MAATPLNTPISGACDASGNATLTVSGPTNLYSTVYVAIQVSAGNPTYTVLAGIGSAGLPLIFGSGKQSQLGPFVLSAGNSLQVTVTGATALATISGQVIGWQSTDPGDIPQLLPSLSQVSIVGGTVTATITAGTVSITGAVTTISPGKAVTGQPFAFVHLSPSVNITVDPNALAICLIANTPTYAGTAPTVGLTGTTTGNDYSAARQQSLAVLPSSSVQRFLFGVNPELDSVLQLGVSNITVTDPGVTIYVSWIYSVEEVYITGNVPTLVSIAGSSINVPVTNAVAGPFQEADTISQVSVALASAATSTLVAGVSGQTIHVIGFELVYDTAVAAEYLMLEDSTGVQGFLIPSGVVGPHTGPGAGATRLPVASGLRLRNSTATSKTVRGWVATRQI